MAMSVYSEDSGRSSSLSEKLDGLSSEGEEEYLDEENLFKKKDTTCKSSNSDTVQQVNRLMETYESLVMSAARKIQQLNKEKESLEAEKDRLLTQNNDSKVSLEVISQHVQQNEADKRCLMETNKSLSEMLSDLLRQNELWKAEKNELLKNQHILKDEIDSGKRENAALKNCLQNLLSELHELEAKYRELSPKFENKSKELFLSIYEKESI